ncbi:MAG: DUF58 domain-containing protein [Chloroflexota bacterium]|nr:DUF58 domain-containing protein [Chloroflexota bacterium]
MDSQLLNKLDRLSLSIGRDLIAGLMGEHQAARRTTGIEFADYRQYSPSDDIRRVDWNAYARLGTLHVRQAQAEHDTNLLLLVDGSPSMDYGEPDKFVVARRLAAALGYIALAHLDSVAILAPGALQRARTGEMRQVPIARMTFRGRAEAGNLFRHLDSLRTGQAADFDGPLAVWNSGQGATAGRIAIIISDLLLDGYQAGVKQLVSEGYAVTMFHLLSPDELQPPEAGDFEFVDSETGQQLEVRLGPESLAEYNSRLNNWLEESATWCRANGVNYLLMSSDQDIERMLLDTLRRRGITTWQA